MSRGEGDTHSENAEGGWEGEGLGGLGMFELRAKDHKGSEILECQLYSDWI